VSKGSRQHHANESGKPASGVTSAGKVRPLVDRRFFGDPSKVVLDGVDDSGSGKTPPPPPFSMRALVVGLSIAFVLGVGLLTLLMIYGPRFAHR
jgi:hypothetical protein